MSNRKEIEIEGNVICVAPPEYVILRKLQYYSEGRSDKHLKDISSMLEISSDRINIDMLRKMIAKYGLKEEWEKEVGDFLISKYITQNKTICEKIQKNYPTLNHIIDGLQVSNFATKIKNK